MAYWLMKSEPFEWSWEQQVAARTAPWTGVRNYQARNFMKDMKKGDLSFFYHSSKGLEIAGIVEIVKTHYPDPADERFVLVDVRAKQAMKTPVPLAALKARAELQDMPLIRQPRLSVMPVTEKEWKTICTMGGLPQS
ncbi:MAG: EVE domain-containing protein [Micavibrio aeruginosavorus]|nr:EVE domain-containing protein [Micavibrio aeruginosavorus]